MRSKSSLLAHHHDAPRGCDFEKSLSVQHFYCGTFNFFSTAIKAKILKRSQPKISDEDDPLSVGTVVYIIKVLRTFKGTFDEKEIVELKTPTNGIENFCKVKLNVKETYLLTGKKRRRSAGNLA